ncbi:hypothetical protein AHiyo1_42580 [Arthrobacter sp. Hiyo1]|nr:hypothetical protein AHiyo1_42580 [Arthrobacter sp. Hiyo1]
MNLTDSVRLLARFGDRVVDEPVSAGISAVPFESAMAVRSFFSWPGKRNYEGSWWSSTMRAHVGFESLLERDFAMLADHDGDVVGISSQPFALLWPHGTEHARGHVPDFFLRLRDGGGRVVDVRPVGHADSAADQFEMSRQACQEVGWEYEVFTGIPEPLGSNVRWLAGYRQDRFAPGAEVLPAIAAAFAEETPMKVGVRRVARGVGLDRSMVHAHVLNLLFTGVLTADHSQPLALDSPVSIAVEWPEQIGLEAAS